MRLAALFPTSGTALHLSHRENRELILTEMIDDLVGEPCDENPFPLRGGQNWRSDLWLVDDGDSNEQLGPKARALALVPLYRSGELRGGGLRDSDGTFQRPGIDRSIRRFTASQGSSFVLPAFREATRWSISACQAHSASGSVGSSRLASSSAASCARDSESRRSASASTASVAFVMQEVILPGAPPNNRFHPASSDIPTREGTAGEGAQRLNRRRHTT